MKLINALSNQSGPHIDLVSVDQIWLGEFAKKGLVTNLTDRAQKWGHLSDWYQSNLDGSLYNNTIYGIWAWTDVRGIWYWKDLLNEAGINSSSLETWQGYIESAKKLNNALKDREIQGTILFDAALSPDLWYPYLWMLGGNIIELKGGHPTKGAYWFPAYNGTEGVRAMQFIKERANAGIKPENGDLKNLDQEFALKRLAEYLYLPTQKTIGEGNYSNLFERTLPYSQEMLSLIQFGHGRPTIPEYPSIAEHIRQAINEVQYGIKEPKQALDDAAVKSAKTLGW